MIFHRALSTDAAALTALMHGSAAYRGDYAAILAGYAVTADQIERDLIVVAEAEGAILGFYSLTLGEEPELDLMFVADAAQGSGLGRRLFDHMRWMAAGQGIANVTIVSHPPSVGFYRSMAAVPVGVKPAGGKATWDRPVLRLTIVDGIEKALADIAAGRLVPHEEVIAKARRIVEDARKLRE
jgi:GNAT superfamily N-acetyltransferase